MSERSGKSGKGRGKGPRKRRILANPDEPNAGDFAFGLYDKAHPVFGDPWTIGYMRGQLQGLGGKHVKVVLRGRRKSEDGEYHRWTVTRSLTLRNYNDVFGPGSVMASGLHQIRDKYSEDILILDSFDIEEV